MYQNVKTWEEQQYCVYVVLDSKYKKRITLNKWDFDYIPKYIGKGTIKRPFTHRQDLLSDNLRDNSERYILTYPSYNLSEDSAYEIESILIDAALETGFKLSPKGLRNSETQEFQLWNKIRGHRGSNFRKTSIGQTN